MTTCLRCSYVFDPIQAVRDNEDLVFVVGDSGVILKSTDGGSSWTSLTSRVSTTLYKVAFLSTTVGFVVGKGGVLLKTSNGGSTWSPKTTGAPSG